jgi:nitrite reductase/ring-hydroxylating ferredoxin subunit
MEKDQFVDAAKLDEIPAGKMKHVEVNGKEIVIANMNGKIYALDDRCVNAPLSMGNLTGEVVTCSFHGACHFQEEDQGPDIRNS